MSDTYESIHALTIALYLLSKQDAHSPLALRISYCSPYVEGRNPNFVERRTRLQYCWLCRLDGARLRRFLGLSLSSSLQWLIPPWLTSIYWPSVYSLSFLVDIIFKIQQHIIPDKSLASSYTFTSPSSPSFTINQYSHHLHKADQLLYQCYTFP